jgi:hypothetical protein
VSYGEVLVDKVKCSEVSYVEVLVDEVKWSELR